MKIFRKNLKMEILKIYKTLKLYEILVFNFKILQLG